MAFLFFRHKYRWETESAADKENYPYLACCYDGGNLAHVNVVAFYHPLINDWEVMEADPNRYRQRVLSAIREEMIHASG